MFAKKNIRLYIFTVILFVFISCFAIAVNAQNAEFDGYIVKLSEPLPVISTFSECESTVKQLEFLEDVYIVEDESIVQMLVEEDIVAYVEPNYILEYLSDIPNDTQYENQWTLDAINYSALYKGGYDGSGVTVAIIDSGLDITHPDFVDTKISEYSKNFLGDGTHTDVFYRDQHGHGSFVASQIAAATDNREGMVGISSGAEIMVLRCVSKTTSEKYLYDSTYDSGSGSVANISAAICYAADNGADVINISLGSKSSSSTLADAVSYAHNKGVIIVAAAGNSGSTAQYYPANCEHVIGVGSVSVSGDTFLRSNFSQYNTSVDVTAPGGNVLGIQIYPNGDGVWYTDASETYLLDSGTSYSSPVVSALAAIVKQVNPDLDGDDFLSLLTVTSYDLGTSGYDTSYGYGLADAEKLLKALVEDEYTINYVLSDFATMPKTYAKTYTLSRNSTLALPTPTRDGYIFAGWCFEADYSGIAYYSLPLGTIGNASAITSDGTGTGYSIAPITLYAKWTVSSSISPRSVNYDIYTDEDITVTFTMPDNTFDGITFDGSALSDECYSYSDETVILNSDFLHSLQTGTHRLTFCFSLGDNAVLKLHVTDSAPRYTVTFYPAYGFAEAHYTLKNVRQGSMVGNLPNPPNLADRVFVGWYLADSTTRITKNTVVNSDLEVYAKWTYTGEGEDEGIDTALSANISATMLTEREVYEKFVQYVSDAEIFVYDVSISGYIPEAGVNVITDFVAAQSFVYFVSGDYLTLAESYIAENGTAVFKAKTDGCYVVSNKQLVTYGDANGDGRITLVDILRVLKRITDNSVQLDVAAADCNQDCNINILDLIMILRIVLNK